MEAVRKDYKVVQREVDKRYSVFEMKSKQFSHVPGCPWYSQKSEAYLALIDIRHSDALEARTKKGRRSPL